MLTLVLPVLFLAAFFMMRVLWHMERLVAPHGNTRTAEGQLLFAISSTSSLRLIVGCSHHILSILHMFAQVARVPALALVAWVSPLRNVGSGQQRTIPTSVLGSRSGSVHEVKCELKPFPAMPAASNYVPYASNSYSSNQGQFQVGRYRVGSITYPQHPWKGLIYEASMGGSHSPTASLRPVSPFGCVHELGGVLLVGVLL